MPPRRTVQPPAAPAVSALPSSHLTTVGLPRPTPGTAGRSIGLKTNHFLLQFPGNMVYHYTVDITPKTKNPLPKRAKDQIIQRLQHEVKPQLFKPRGVYDGDRSFYSSRKLPLGQGGSAESEEFAVPHEKPGRSWTVKLTKVAAEVNLEVIRRVVAGKQSMDSDGLEGHKVLNVVLNMYPRRQYPSTTRSFYIPEGLKDIGGGIELWRGFYTSVRPSLKGVLVNVDTSTTAMHKSGPLISACLEALGFKGQTAALYEKSIRPDQLKTLSKYVSNLRVTIDYPNAKSVPKALKGVVATSASTTFFETSEGKKMSVKDYWKKTYNKDLRFPQMILARSGTTSLIPLELCDIIPGQPIKLPTDKTKPFVEFATMKPPEKMAAIQNGWRALGYGDSEHLADFKVTVGKDLLQGSGRLLNPPQLRVGPPKGPGKQPTLTPRDGQWNMGNNRFHTPKAVKAYAIVIVDPRFSDNFVKDLAASLAQAARDCGMEFPSEPTVVQRENPQTDPITYLRAAGTKVREKKKVLPDLLVVVIPTGAGAIYESIKHFGDTSVGVATQCLLGEKCSGRKSQYFFNVMLKINAKLGGVNFQLELPPNHFLRDPNNPVIIIGADCVHPPPDSQGRPSFSSVVSSVDSDCVRYIAAMRVQKARQENIEESDLIAMVKNALQMNMGYKKAMEKKSPEKAKPTRLLYYRDGVSEGQYADVINETAIIKKAAQEMGLNLKVTAVVVGKRHHVRFQTLNPSDADRSGNVPAGMVCDTLVGHPIEWDFYLLSHAGLLGTSRPAHYAPVVDENKFTQDSIQALSFALCHIYARSTRSVSIPAPVYYADRVCDRWRNHYSAAFHRDVTESGTVTSTDEVSERRLLQQFKDNFKAAHQNSQKVMYFM